MEGKKLSLTINSTSMRQKSSRSQKQYKNDNDWLQQFISECCKREPTAKVGAGEHMKSIEPMHGREMNMLDQVLTLKAMEAADS